MLQNAYLLLKIGADTAENERNSAKNVPKIGQKLAKNWQLPYGSVRRPRREAWAPSPRRPPRRRKDHGRAVAGRRASRRRQRDVCRQRVPQRAESQQATHRLDRANLRGLVLGCIEAKFCK